MRWLNRLILGVVMIALVAFGILGVNQQKVSLRFLDYQSPEIDLFFYLLAALVIGILIGWLTAGYSMFSLKLAERRERKQKLQAQNELEAVKAQLPAAE